MPGGEALDETFHATARGAGLCVGRAFAGVDVKIVAIDDEPIATLARAREMPRGEIGEVIVRGAHISPAYADDIASTLKNKIADAGGGTWHRLGDAGYLDDQGRLWCCGRVGHRLKLPSGPLFPLVCEPIFDAHPLVRRSGLVSVPVAGERAGIVPVICVELVEGAKQVRDLDTIRAELLAAAAANPATQQIRHVLFHPRLPVDPRHNSKIERPALARWAASHLPRAQRKRAVRELAPVAFAGRR
jgi:acyl-CoA synthetase (AMP-forming)/AMP-acid ligase II